MFLQASQEAHSTHVLASFHSTHTFRICFSVQGRFAGCAVFRLAYEKKHTTHREQNRKKNATAEKQQQQQRIFSFISLLLASQRQADLAAFLPSFSSTNKIVHLLRRMHVQKPNGPGNVPFCFLLLSFSAQAESGLCRPAHRTTPNRSHCIRVFIHREPLSVLNFYEIARKQLNSKKKSVVVSLMPLHALCVAIYIPFPVLATCS